MLSPGLPQEETVRLHMPYPPHDSISLLQKVEWEHRLACVTVRHPLDLHQQLWIYMPEWRELAGETDWREKQPYHKRLAFRKIWNIEEIEILPAGTKQRTSHHRSPRGERVERALRSTVFFEQSWKDKTGPSSTTRTVEPFQRQRRGNSWEMGWSAYGLSGTHRYHLELNWIIITWRHFVCQRRRTLPKNLGERAVFWSSTLAVYVHQVYHWRKLLQVSLAGTATSIFSFLFCRDKSKFVATKLSSQRQTRVRRDHSFVALSIVLSRQAYFCHDKRVFCRDKHKTFVATKMIRVAASASDKIQPYKSTSIISYIFASVDIIIWRRNARERVKDWKWERMKTQSVCGNDLQVVFYWIPHFDVVLVRASRFYA